ncbi:MAG: 4Fe-4S binding protein [Methanomassiliicoccus sp.]|nr:4Fe-4S binding protein [Methanomassiliicoccus sp.]
MALKLALPKASAEQSKRSRPRASSEAFTGLSLHLPKVVRNNIERYLGLLLGFFLFVGPFAVFTWFAFYLTGTEGNATLHSICYRLPLDWLTGGTAATVGSLAAVFIIGVLIVALLFGPLFCGRLCPVGAVSELLSRAVPLPDRYRMRIKDTRVTVSLRYGFLVGFILMGWFVGGQSVQCSYGVNLGRYCSSSILEYMSQGLFSGAAPVNYWNTGLVLTLITWLVLGGIMMVGGRGWCLFFCPLGALSGLSHALGSRLGLYHVRFDENKCRHCRRCEVQCPMWAIGLDRRVETSLCMNCGECVHNCSFKAYRAGFGRSEKGATLAFRDAALKVKSSGAFVLASSTAPVAAIMTGPCATVGCAGCPLGGACAVAMPLLFGSMLVSQRSSGIRKHLAALRSRFRRWRKG